MASKNMGRPVLNKFGVPKKQWNKWSNTAKRVFNYMYQELRPRCQWVFLHPKTAPLPREQWETTRWNVAWIAANGVDKIPPNTHIVPVNSKGVPVGKARKLRK